MSSGGDKRDPEFALAWAVEFAELNALPATEGEAAVIDDDGDAVADEGGFGVAVAVSFAVLGDR
jgi:hypothetical protein